MTVDRQYRYENKYPVNEIQLEEMRLRVSSVCLPDKYVNENGEYLIRSVYFDDFRDSAYHANEIGYEPRSKWRIRMYNCDESFISLERKRKVRGLIAKDSTIISRDLCEKILRGDSDIEYPCKDGLLNVFLTEVYTKQLSPCIIIQYCREPYVEHAGNVRITFDTKIEYSYEAEGFFKKDLFFKPLDSVCRNLMEVKYTGVFPKHIQGIVDNSGLQRITFSKYYLSRKEGDRYYHADI